VRSSGIAITRVAEDDKSINKVCLRTHVGYRGGKIERERERGGGEETRAIDMQKWSVVYASASKAIHPPYMEISLVPDTYNTAACLMVESGSSHRTDALLGT